jgi:ribosomal protein L11 methyltransferase
MTKADLKSETLVARVAADRATAQRIGDLLAEALDPEHCAVSIYEQGAEWVAEAVFTRVEDGDQVERLIEQVLGTDAASALSISSIAERDWVASSLEGLAPVIAGRFVIHGAHDRTRIRSNQIGIEIEAALAFGTGHHGTTRGCLLAFEALRKRMRFASRCRILDIGTGTGVLGIAAARALHVPVMASDIDPVAVAVAIDNARLNHAGALFQCFTAAGAEAQRFRTRGRYDLIFANILEAPLRRMSRPLTALLAPSGRLILSGLLPAHAKGVISAYRSQGLVLEARLPVDGWVTLTMRR